MLEITLAAAGVEQEPMALQALLEVLAVQVLLKP